MEVALDTGESLKLNDVVFNVDFNASLVHQVVQAYLSNGHSGPRRKNHALTFVAEVRNLGVKKVVVARVLVREIAPYGEVGE